ncbi:MAG: response regulator transcription factor [Acidimicrobiales bacterium]
MRVLLVSSDHDNVMLLAETLQHEGFDVNQVGSAADALQAGPVEVVILDGGLPDLSSLELCRRLRDQPDGDGFGIMMMSSCADEVDRVMGLELGADDYVGKPISQRELVARVRAVGRRVLAQHIGPTATDLPQVLGSLTINRAARRVLLDEDEVDFTAKEFDLLACLAEAPGRVYPRRELLTELWDPHWYGPTKTVDVHVAAIRRKLRNPGWIEAVRGVGFRFQVPLTNRRFLSSAHVAAAAAVAG